MWTAAPIIFEDEDEAALIASFVEYSARYPDRDAFEIAGYVFRNQVDPELRSQQAGMVWSKDLAIIERIRLARLNGGTENNPNDTREDKLRKLEAIYNDVEVAAKDRIKAIELHSQILGQIVKPIDKTVTTKSPRRQIVFAQYSDA